MKSRNTWRVFGGTLLVAALVVAAFLLGKELLRTEVAVAEVIRSSAVNAVPGVVTIGAERTIEMRVEAGGRVVESRLELGGAMEKDALLLRLDETDLRRALDRVKIDLEGELDLQEIGSLLDHDLREAREELARKEEDASRISARELETQRRLVARLTDEIRRERIADRRRVRLLENERQRLEGELEKTVVQASASGEVVEIFVYPGDLVSPRGAVARLLSRGRVIEASLSEENFAGVKPGQLGTVRLLSYGSRLFPATVAKVLPAADPVTQRYTVHLEVEMPLEMMIPGLTGEVSILIGEREGALVIPRRALMGRDVFVVIDGRVEMRTVEPGFVSLNQVEILRGLEEGERVAVENLGRLRAGDRVRVRHHGD